MLETKRRVIGQLIVCQGSCGGATHKDRPEVPVDWLKDEWRRRGLFKDFNFPLVATLAHAMFPTSWR
jgi:hypothetical protein